MRSFVFICLCCAPLNAFGPRHSHAKSKPNGLPWPGFAGPPTLRVLDQEQVLPWPSHVQTAMSLFAAMSNSMRPGSPSAKYHTLFLGPLVRVRFGGLGVDGDDGETISTQSESEPPSLLLLSALLLEVEEVEYVDSEDSDDVMTKSGSAGALLRLDAAWSSSTTPYTWK